MRIKVSRILRCYTIPNHTRYQRYSLQLQVADLSKMATKTTLLTVFALLTFSYGAPIDEVVQAHEKHTPVTHVSGQLKIQPQPPLVVHTEVDSHAKPEIRHEQEVNHEENHQEHDQDHQDHQDHHQNHHQERHQDHHEEHHQEHHQEQHHAVVDSHESSQDLEVVAGEEGPNVLKGAESSEEEKPDLDTANSWGYGWGRRGYYGGGWGGWGGYYRPYWGGYRGYGYGGHGWGRGYGYGGYWG